MEDHLEEDVNDEEVQELMRSEASATTEEQIYEQRRFEATNGDLWISELRIPSGISGKESSCFSRMRTTKFKDAEGNKVIQVMQIERKRGAKGTQN